MPYFDNDLDQGNRIYWAGSNASQYRAHSTYHTVMEAYFTETGDPRAAWVTN
jgi:hypothetical protein